MPAERVESALIAARHGSGLAALAEAILAESFRDARDAAQLSLSLEDPATEVGRYVMSLLAELAIAPLLDARAITGEQEIWVARTLVESQISVRRLLAELRRLLTDPRSVPLPSDRGLKEEVTPPPRRVSDEVYVMLRRTLNETEAEDDYLLNSDIFLNLPESDRDEEITRCARGEPWRNWVEAEVDD